MCKFTCINNKGIKIFLVELETFEETLLIFLIEQKE